MNVEYRKCVSSSCHESINTECPFMYKIIERSMNNSFHVYKSLEDHLKKNVEEKDSIRGINQYYKDEIDSIVN